jgi:hypothetical protein
VLRTIPLTLAFGALVLLAICTVLRMQGMAPAPPDPPILTYISAVYAALLLVAYYLVPDRIVSSLRGKLARRETTPNPSAQDSNWLASYARRRLVREEIQKVPNETLQMAALFQVHLLISAALLESAAFFLGIVYFIEGNSLCLAAGLAFVVGVLFKIPTRAGLERWIETQRELLQQERTG